MKEPRAGAEHGGQRCGSGCRGERRMRSAQAGSLPKIAPENADFLKSSLGTQPSNLWTEKTSKRPKTGRVLPRRVRKGDPSGPAAPGWELQPARGVEGGEAVVDFFFEIKKKKR